MMQSPSFQHHLAIQARRRPEILERVLRVVRHRGFEIHAMNMAQDGDCDSVSIELTVASTRPVTLLSSQLSKLLDVARVDVSASRSLRMLPRRQALG
ncbi:acetolactate synthase 2 small subunit [Edwardsiella piscicida]|uniref:acetolactate synthase 2 small subunit n=1 Tax=Edwardsiella piscicida TaxID=1263550 RepID=UPI0009349D2A|nr:acetolactate synthase 2 small subunit [Edwardsiella piscicida]EKS7813745.1 acetolactate synthase 2 small subunit [Edwardsiella piscicida]UCQ21214.1 acetolactate synthase 2 small subunit [Edwardsiella piscicida]WAM44793.1 acetolactate synthase 2 small subunit [Edwardsiella piscicida]